MPKRSTAPSVLPITVRLSFLRGTKNWYQYYTPDDGAALQVVYVRRNAFRNSRPSWVTVRVERSTGLAPKLESD